MNKFRIGVIGAGYGSAHYPYAPKSFSSVQVTGIAGLDSSRERSRAKAFSLPTAYSNSEDLLAGGALIHGPQPVLFSTIVEMEASR